MYTHIPSTDEGNGHSRVLEISGKSKHRRIVGISNVYHDDLHMLARWPIHINNAYHGDLGISKVYHYDLDNHNVYHGDLRIYRGDLCILHQFTIISI